MIDDELREHAQFSPLGLLHEAPEIGHGAEIGIDGAVIRNVVAVVTAGRGIERQQPDCRDAEILEIIELSCQSCEIPDAVVVAVGKRLDVKLVNDRVLEPQLVAIELRLRLDVSHYVHGRPSRVAAEQQRRILLLVNAQAHPAPLEHVALAGDEILDELHARAPG